MEFVHEPQTRKRKARAGIDVEGAQYQLPLPEGMAHVHGLSPAHAVRVFPGLLEEDGDIAQVIQNLCPMNWREASITLQFWYGARQIFMQTLRELGQGESESAFVNWAPHEPRVQSAGINELFMEIYYLSVIAEWFVSHARAPSVRKLVGERIYAYWPVKTYAPDQWLNYESRDGLRRSLGVERNPFLHCCGLAERWLYGRGQNQYAATLRRAPTRPFPAEAFSSLQHVENVTKLFEVMRLWAKNTHGGADQKVFALLFTRKVLYLFLCACVFKVRCISTLIARDTSGLSAVLLDIIEHVESKKPYHLGQEGWVDEFLAKEERVATDCMREIW
jgi:hypothetical protein